MPVKPGFSAIELLLVAGIISLLVAMAVPNYLDAKIRAEIADVQSTMRQTSSAIEIFKIDHNRLPEKETPNSSETAFRELNPYLNFMPVDRFKKSVASEEYGPLSLYSDPFLYYDNLNTPMSQTIFAKVLRRDRFDSFTPNNQGNNWVLKSIGPDQTDFQDEGLGRGTYQPNVNGLTRYDSSNGLFSLGEIVRVHLGD